MMNDEAFAKIIGWEKEIKLRRHRSRIAALGIDQAERERLQRQLLAERIKGREPKPIDIDDMGCPHLREDL